MVNLIITNVKYYRDGRVDECSIQLVELGNICDDMISIMPLFEMLKYTLYYKITVLNPPPHTYFDGLPNPRSDDVDIILKWRDIARSKCLIVLLYDAFIRSSNMCTNPTTVEDLKSEDIICYKLCDNIGWIMKRILKCLQPVEDHRPKKLNGIRISGVSAGYIGIHKMVKHIRGITQLGVIFTGNTYQLRKDMGWNTQSEESERKIEEAYEILDLHWEADCIYSYTSRVCLRLSEQRRNIGNLLKWKKVADDLRAATVNNTHSTTHNESIWSFNTKQTESIW